MTTFCFVAPDYRAVDVLRGDTRSSGGAESQMAYVAADLARLGVSVKMIYGDGLRTAPSERIAGVECIHAFPNWRRPGSLVRFLSALVRSRADYFYANLPDDFLFLIALARLLRRRSRFVYALANDTHCNPWSTFKHRKWFHNPLYALGLFAADYVTLQHEAQRTAVAPYVRGKLVPVPNLLRRVEDRPRSFDDTKIDVLWVALVRPQKQLGVLLDAAERLRGMHFAVVGRFDDLTLEGEEIRRFEERIQELDNVEYYGALHQTEILKLLRASKMLVSTSLFEGFPNTMLEAWSQGVPVVSLEVDPGGVISREGIGLISGSFPNLLRDIERLAEEQGASLELGRRGLAYVRRQHSLEAVCAAMEPISPGIRSCYEAVFGTG